MSDTITLSLLVGSDGKICISIPSEPASPRDESTENNSVKTDPEKGGSDCDQRTSDKRETVWVAGDGGNRPTKSIKLDGLLYLTVPHLSGSEQDNAERNQKSIVISRCDGSYSNENTGNNKRNGPLSVIANLLGIHFGRQPFLEINCRFHLEADGRVSQETMLSPRWILVDSRT